MCWIFWRLEKRSYFFEVRWYLLIDKLVIYILSQKGACKFTNRGFLLLIDEESTWLTASSWVPNFDSILYFFPNSSNLFLFLKRPHRYYFSPLHILHIRQKIHNTLPIICHLTLSKLISATIIQSPLVCLMQSSSLWIRKKNSPN